MLRLIAALVLLAGFAATAPVIAIPPGPPIANKQTAAEKQHGDNALLGNQKIELTVGASKNSPLYVSTQCEHGCGYAEHESWFDRLRGDPNAGFAGVVMVFTLGLLISAVWQGILTRQTINLARNEFLASNPPHLVVRNVHCRGANPEDEIVISFEVINCGKSNAHIVASAFRTDSVGITETFHDLTLFAVGEPPKNVLGNRILKPGAVLRETFNPGGKWTADDFHDYGDPTIGFFFGGKILYRDNLGNQRRLGILRRLALPSRRFRPVNDPEFEYGD